MFDYLQKFNNLPQTLRDKVSSPAAMRAISALELKYKVDLAALVMKVMTKTLAIDDLLEYFINEFSLSQGEARSLKDDILKEILAPVSDYLNLDKNKKQPEITEFSSALIKEAGISLPSEDLYLRLRNIILTFLKGVRSKIDAKNSLIKKVEFGGLGLTQEEADKIFKLLDEQGRGQKKNSPRTEDLEIKTPEKSSKEKLDQIIMAAEANSASAYDLKRSLTEQNNESQTLQVEKEAMLPKEIAQVLLPLEEEEVLLPLTKDKLQLEEKLDLESKPEEKVEEKPKLKLEPDLEVKEKVEEKHAIEEKPESKTKEKPEPEITKEQVLKFEEKPELKSEESTKQEDYVASTTLNLNFKRPAPTSTKPRIEDIKPVAKVMSPIDELAFLDLVNFRRLASNADEAVLKIFNKIKLLEREGYDKMVLGVKAWRQNQVNRLYVKIGQESLLKDLSLNDIIVERQKKNMPYLKIEEINAISKLNGRLSF